jgi:glycosyltransferase involved in cell wall biosynthesis
MPRTVIVVPCYNEAARLDKEAVRAFLREEAAIGLCLVDDGSTDGTRAILEGIAAGEPGRLEVLPLDENGGKAEAVRRGALHVVGNPGVSYVGYWDADLATPLGDVPAFVSILDDRPEVVLVSGARIRRLGVHIDRRGVRHILGRVFATCASLALGLPVYDTQCGAKLLRADIARAVFVEPFLSRWLFDVELFARVRGMVGREACERRVVELPLARWVDVGGSKLRLRHWVRAPLDLLRIYLRYR